MASNVIVGQALGSAQERIVFGQPAGDAIVAEAERYGAKRVFVVSTSSLLKLADGPLRSVERALGLRHVGTYGTVKAHSPREDVIAGAAAARQAGADLLVAVGGGSAVDATKAMLMCLWHDLRDADAMEPFRKDPSSIKPPVDPIRMLSVTTTLSASEFTAIAGVTDSRAKAKQSFTHRLFAPRSAVLDPAATLETPDWLLFSTGIRSVDHAVECYCAPNAHPGSEALSLQGLRLLSRALPRIKAAPGDLAARQEAQFGMWQAIAGLTMGVSTGASHGIGYALGATYNVAHGHTSCVMLSPVLRWNAAVNGARQRALSEAMGEPAVPATDLIRRLVAGLDQPVSLRAVGIKAGDLDAISKAALVYEPVRKNPRPITTPADVREILDLAW